MAAFGPRSSAAQTVHDTLALRVADRLTALGWIDPKVVTVERESDLLVVACFHAAEGEKRIAVTAYLNEETDEVVTVRGFIA